MKTTRRYFMGNALLGAIATPIAASRLVHAGEDRVKKGSMIYRKLGRTGLFISELSLGSSPLPDWGILRQAIEGGINYIDTSHSYGNGNAERTIGKLLKEVGRDAVIVGTKFHLRGDWSEASIIETVEGSLSRLQSDSIDVLMIHGANDEKQLVDDRVLNAFSKLKKQGKYRFSGLSCHRNHESVVKKAVECGQYDTITLAYNAFDLKEPDKDVKRHDDYLEASGTRELIRLARSRDIGVIAMKTLKVGGPQQNLDRYRTGDTSIHQAMLKWVLDNDDVSGLITEMLTYDHLEENLAAVGSQLTTAERSNLNRFVAERSRDYCHLCGACQERCPSSIETTDIQRYLAYFESYGKEDKARRSYAFLAPSATADACGNCGECERACPYGVSVRSRIQLAHHVLHHEVTL